MRQIFSVRFFAAVGGVVALFFLLTTIFATREVIDGDGGRDDSVQRRGIDFVEQVFSSSNQGFQVVDGLAVNDTELVIDGERSLRVVTDTPGINLCPRFPEIGACAVVADLLGEGVVWFALVPMGSGRTVDLPAIDTLDDGIATLTTGWQVPFAPILDRRCSDEYSSYRELRDALGNDFTAVFGLEERRLIAVRCNVRVPYAPAADAGDRAAAEATTTTSLVPASTTVPSG